MQESRFTYRSVFWPILLIGVGLVLFLGNMQVIPGYDWRKLAALWPLLLVGVGLDLIVGRRNVWVSALIGIATVGGAVLMLAYAPAIGMFQNPDVKTYNYSEPVGSATSARVKLDLSFESTRVRALSDPAALFQADITHAGAVSYSAQGSGTEKTISLGSSGQINWFFNAPSFPTEWVIGLGTAVPVALEVDVSAGSANLDLTGLQLISLDVDGGAGSCNIKLPAQAKAYTASYNGSAGSGDIQLPADADLTLRLDGSAGSINVRLPANAAVRVEVLNEGVGGLGLASRLKKISGSSQKKGVWETEGYASAARKINIIVKDISAGSINIR